MISKKQNCVKKGYLNIAEIAEKSIGSSIEDQKKTLEKGYKWFKENNQAATPYYLVELFLNQRNTFIL